MIASREYVIKTLAELITEPKKKYSQNFLTDSEIVKKAVDSLNLLPSDEVIEVGPGLGALTEEVALRGNSITGYEIDEVMVHHLKSYFAKRENVTIVSGDFLKQNLSAFKDKKVSFISNIPYALTTPIIEKIIKEKIHTKYFTFMIQREVAARINAKVGSKEYSPLSIMMNYLGKVDTVVKVGKDKFIPSPNVDSIILCLAFKQERDFVLEEKLFKLLNASFSMRRKTILNNLNSYIGNKEKAQEVLTKSNLSFLLRPEQITIDQYLEILKNI